MVTIIIANDADTRFEIDVLLDEICCGGGTVQSFSDPQRLLRYAQRNIDIYVAFIEYDFFEPGGGVKLAELLRELHSNVRVIYIFGKNILLNRAPCLDDSRCLRWGMCVTENRETIFRRVGKGEGEYCVDCEYIKICESDDDDLSFLDDM